MEQPILQPRQETMDELRQPFLELAPSAPPLQPWEVGAQNMYAEKLNCQSFSAPNGWSKEERQKTLREWGRKRERRLHRKPRCLMDQMVSGSGLYPPRLLDDTWFTEEENAMIKELELLLESTGHARSLARDILTPLLHDVNVAIVLDDSGSMTLDMFGQPVGGGEMSKTSPWQPLLLHKSLRASLPGGWFTINRPIQPAECPVSPHHRRWFFAKQHLQSWAKIFSILKMDPPVYALNARTTGYLSQIDEIFNSLPSGSTPMSQTLRRLLRDLAPSSGRSKSLLILVLTDGEANDMKDFNLVLDEIQNMRYGDVQVCLMGLSLVKEDIEWFENEECDESRIRTIEAFEVENRQIQLKEVTRREGGYTFDMHVMRALVTNYFPADYDYEAPLQNLAHRMYITAHGRDRWWGIQNPLWNLLCTNLCCPVCFLLTGCHCCGWFQGNDCGKYQTPDCLRIEE